MARSPLRMKSCLRKVTPDELKGANVLFGYLSGGAPYTRKEKRAIREFLEAGGTFFLVYRDGQDTVSNFLRE